MAASPTREPALPPAAMRLGHAGLLPFVFGAALVWLVDERAREYLTLGLSAYAALTVSFLGGILWGAGFSGDHAPSHLFVKGMVPIPLAWAAVMMPANAGLVLGGVTLVLCYLIDRRTYPSVGLQRWLTLRFRLSAVAASCCFLAAAGA